MSGAPRRRCPVCWQTVIPTRGHNIARHWDSAGRDVCPMSGEPYELAQVGKRRIVIEFPMGVSA